MPIDFTMPQARPLFIQSQACCSSRSRSGSRDSRRSCSARRLPRMTFVAPSRDLQRRDAVTLGTRQAARLSGRSRAEPASHLSAAPRRTCDEVLISYDSWMADINAGDETAVQELLKLLGEVHPACIPGAPAILYHYTTAVGLAGIVSAGHFRGTNFSILNDFREFRYAALGNGPAANCCENTLRRERPRRSCYL